MQGSSPATLTDISNKFNINDTTHTVTGLTAGQTYYFGVAVQDAAGQNGDTIVSAAYMPSAVNANIGQSGEKQICLGDSQNIQVPLITGNTYTWYRNGMVIPSATSNSFEAKELGSYYVEVMSGGCSATSDTLRVLPVPVAETLFEIDKDTLLACVPDDGTTISLFANGYPVAVRSLDLTAPQSYVALGHPSFGNNFYTHDGSTGFTAEAWIKYNGSLPDFTGILNKAGSGFPFTGYELLLVENKLAAEIGNGTSNLSANTLKGTTPLNDGFWHHVAMVIDPSGAGFIRLFVDGNQEIELSSGMAATLATADLFTTDSLQVGRNRNKENNKTFDGYIDAVRLWDTAYGQAGVADLMQTVLYRFPSGTPSLSASVNFDEDVSGFDDEIEGVVYNRLVYNAGAINSASEQGLYSTFADYAVQSYNWYKVRNNIPVLQPTTDDYFDLDTLEAMQLVIEVNNGICSYSDTLFVDTLDSYTAPPLQVIGSSTVCEGDSIQLVVENNDDALYLNWSPKFFNDTATVYTSQTVSVIVEETTTRCYDTLFTEVTVKPAPFNEIYFSDAVSLSSTNRQEITDVLMLDDGYKFVCGVFTNSMNYDGFALTSNGGIDGFIAMHDDVGNAVWINQIGGSGDDEPKKLGYFGDGSPQYVSVAGDFTSSSLLLGNTNVTNKGGSDIFYAIYEADFTGNGSFFNSSFYYNTTSNEKLTDLVTVNDEAFITGITDADTIIYQGFPDNDTLTSNGGTDGLLVSMDFFGFVNKIAMIGTSGNDEITALHAEGHQLYITGQKAAGTLSINGRAAGAGVQSGGIVLKTNQNFKIDWSKNISHTASLSIKDIAVSQTKVFVEADHTGSITIDGNTFTAPAASRQGIVFSLNETNGSFTSAKEVKPGASGSRVVIMESLSKDVYGNLMATGYYISNKMTIDTKELINSTATKANSFVWLQDAVSEQTISLTQTEGNGHEYLVAASSSFYGYAVAGYYRDATASSSFGDITLPIPDGFDPLLLELDIDLLPDFLDTTLCEGTDIDLTVNLIGTGYTYQWYEDGTAITGATAATQTITGDGFDWEYEVDVAYIALPGCLAVSDYVGVTGGFTPEIITNPANDTSSVCPGEALIMEADDFGNWFYTQSGSPIAGNVFDDFDTLQVNSNNEGHVVFVNDDGCSDSLYVKLKANLALNLKVMLQGAYQPATNDMATILETDSSFLTAFYYSTGDSALPTSMWHVPSYRTQSAVPATAVDVVELVYRSTDALKTPLDTAYGWLLKDGEVVSYDTPVGSTINTCSDLLAGNYYVQINHRNHLSVMSATALSVSDVPAAVPFDFTAIVNVYGAGPLPLRMASGDGCRRCGKKCFRQKPMPATCSRFRRTMARSRRVIVPRTLIWMGSKPATDFNMSSLANDFLFFSTAP